MEQSKDDLFSLLVIAFYFWI